MTKNQRIKRLEETIRELGKLLGFTIYFQGFEDVRKNIFYAGYISPIRGWEDPKMQALLTHLGIFDIQEEEQPPKEYKVILIKKK